MSIFSKNYETHKETREYDPNTEEKRQSIETIPKEAQMLDLLDKDFKSAFVTMFKELKEIMSEEFKGIMRISHQIGSINRDKNYSLNNSGIKV